MRMRNSLVCVVAILTLLGIGGSSAAQSVSTFTTDGLSYISFGNAEVIPIPVGSTITFRFAAPGADGSATFTIDPGGIDISPIELPNGQGELAYAIVSEASGMMMPTPSGRKIQFNALVRATLARGGVDQGSFEYAMPFTTDNIAASNLDGTQTLSTYGMRVVDGVWFAQIVGATTNKGNAFPEPGAAVYTILSGSFDTMPEAAAP